MWYLSKLAMKNRAVTIFLAALIAAASIWATFQLKLEMIPDIQFPYVLVYAAYPDATPDEVEEQVTVPIENVIWDEWEGKGLSHLYSTSADQISVVFAEFDFGTDMEEVNAFLETTLNSTELDLPQAVRDLPLMSPRVEENPQVLAIDMSMMPLVAFSLTGGNVTIERLGLIAQEQVLPELQMVEGIAEVQIEGGEKDQVLVTIDPEQINELGLPMSVMLGLISATPEYGSLTELESIPVGVDNVALGNITQTVVGPAPGTMISRVDGDPAVLIVVMKDQDANTVEVANAVTERAEEVGSALGETFEISAAFDQSDFIEESIGELTQMALIGGILAIVIVFLFLATFRASLVTALSIPFSIVIGFLAMYLSGITINLLTLSAMAIAVGRLIDNSIVVAEVIYRRMKSGEGFMEASIGGSKEVAGPITSSTLATVAIFIPLMFVGGIVGELFIPFALTITFALIASLLVALMVVPAFSRWFVGKRANEKEIKAGDTWYQRLYIPPLKWALGHRFWTLVIAGVLFLGSGALLPILGTSFLPSMTEKMLVVEVELPPGTEVETTNEVAGLIEALIAKNEAVDFYYAMIGTSTTSVQSAMAAAFGGGDNTAEIQIMLNDDADEPKEQADLEYALEGLMLQDYTTVLSGDEAMGSQMGFGTGLDVSVSGESAEEVSTATKLLVERLETMDDIVNLETDLSKVVPTLDIELDSEEVAARGLTEQELKQELALLMMGASVDGVSVNVDGDSFGIYIKGVVAQLGFGEDPEKALSLANDLRIGGVLSVPLGDVAVVGLPERQTHIGHIDLNLAASITGEITAKDVGAVNRAVEDEIDAVQEELAELGIDDVEIKPGGVAEEMTESFTKMGAAIIIAIIIAYLILVVTMRSILNPLIIMVSLPLASIGALLGLLIAGQTLGMSAMMGMLMLVGIVLTNAIVLIALVEQLRKEGTNTYDALVEGGRTRLRPILMTALTTMFAMVPLAFGVGGGTLIAAELAVVVIGGLFSSTLLTLLVIPVIYSLVDGLRHRVSKAE